MKNIITAMVVAVVMFGCIAGAQAKKKEKITVVAGTAVPRLGMAFDTSYDARFDDFVPGYKIVQVAIMNNSFNMVPMDPKKDRYVVQTLEGRKKYKAKADLQYADPKAWKELPDRARKVITYPLILPIGAREVIDLFVPSNAPLESFRGVEVDIHSMDTKIELVARN